MGLFQIPIEINAINNGKIVSYYKYRNGNFHDGIDYRATIGTPVLATYEGTVFRASENTTSIFGNVIIIDHGVIDGRRTYTLYAHLDGYNVEVGDTVEAGEQIGTSGDSGVPGQPHLHFEVLQSNDENPIPGLLADEGPIGINTGDYAVNPLQFVYGDGLDITHTLNTVNDTGQNYATAWGDIGNDWFNVPAPDAEFTAANLYGKRGDDTLVGNINNDRLHGGFGNDTLIGGAGSDMLWGWQENVDTNDVPERIRELEDDGGNDELIGGISRTEDDNAPDQLFGGNGFDTYHVGNGDIINDADDRGRVFYNGAVLVPGLHGSEQEENQYVSLDGRFTYTLNNTDLTVLVNGSEPPISFTIQNFISGNLGIVLRDMPDTSYSSPYQISQEQADGEHIVTDDNDPNTVDFDPSGNDAIIGRAGDDLMVIEPVTQGTVIYGDGPAVAEEQQKTDGILLDFARFSANVGLEQPIIPVPVEGAVVFAQGGDDWIGGSYDHDWIEGGIGHDALEGGYGDDVLIGGAGNDYIDAGAGSDIVIAAELDDATGSDNNLLSGGAGDDTVLGGSGNDWLYGDTRLFEAGLTFENGVVQERYWHGEEFTGELEAGRLHFWHGTWGVDHLRNGGSYYDPVEGAGDDILDGGAGDDQAYGGAGNDQITGGTGEDTLVGEAGDDRLVGGDNDDSLFGDFSQLIYQNDNNVIGFDELFDHDLVTRVYRDPVDTAGNDVLDGGAGNDTLQGGYGNDVYVFGRGYGKDSVYDDAGADRVRLGAGIAEADVALRAVDNILVLELRQDGVLTGDQLTLNNWFNTDRRVEFIEFADGTVWNAAEVLSRLGLTEEQAAERADDVTVSTVTVGDDGDDTAPGTEGNDVFFLNNGDNQATGDAGDDRIYGGEGEDTFSGGDDNDRLFGDRGNDRLDGGTGADVLQGGAGTQISSEVYKYRVSSIEEYRIQEPEFRMAA